MNSNTIHRRPVEVSSNLSFTPVCEFAYPSNFNVTENYTYSTRRSCSRTKLHNNQITVYKLSPNSLDHYEYRYELSNHSLSSNESRLILLLSGRSRSCVDWWKLSVGKSILSPIRSSGFSILSICTSRKRYQTSVSILMNRDVYGIYSTLRIWMKNVYYQRFKHYPRLYLFGVAEGSEMATILSRVLPVQGQILHNSIGHRSSLLVHSDHDRSLQSRLITDYRFANWFYLDYCSNVNETKYKQCPYAHTEKQNFNPVPPTYYVRLEQDTLTAFGGIISDLKKDALNLGGTLLTYRNTINLYTVSSMSLLSDTSDIEQHRNDLCEIVCEDPTVINTLSWLNEMDRLRSWYQVQNFLRRPLRLWMYNKHELVSNAEHLAYYGPTATRCSRQFKSDQMYSAEYFLQDYFNRLNQSYPLTRHNLIWSKDPLLADYYIIPHDYVCMKIISVRLPPNSSKSTPFHIRMTGEYFAPLLNNVRTLFPFWNMTSGANHILPATVGRNMGVCDDRSIINSLEHVIQLVYTGYRLDLLPSNSEPLYEFLNRTPIYRHKYDVVIPAFNRLQSMNNLSITNTTSLKEWYKMKENLFFFAGQMNHSNSLKSPRTHLSLLLSEDIGEGKKYPNVTVLVRKQLNTMTVIDGFLPDSDYVEMIRRSVFQLCLEGYSPWSPRLYESICLGAIPLILAQSIVLPFERFIDWRSFSTKVNVSNVRNIIDIVQTIDHFEDFVKQKLQHASKYFHAFRWPYSSVGRNDSDQHVFLPEEDLNGTAKNVFHYISLELRCRRLEQFYGLTSDSLSSKSLSAKRQACQNHPKICPCYEEQTSLAVEEYI